MRSTAGSGFIRTGKRGKNPGSHEKAAKRACTARTRLFSSYTNSGVGAVFSSASSFLADIHNGVCVSGTNRSLLPAVIFIEKGEALQQQIAVIFDRVAAHRQDEPRDAARSDDGRAAAKLGIPYALHEQNSVPGLANKQSAKGAALIAIAQPSVSEVFEKHGAPASAIKFTGNPVRASVLAGDRARGRAALDVPDSATLLVAFGGSLGARHLNERLISLKRDLLARDDVYVLHSTGADDYDDTVRALELTPEEAARYRVRPYIDDMGDVLAAADLVLSRAGASSIAEIAALAVPAVLVPYPHATADHQTTNARYLVDAGAALLCPDAQIDSQDFADTLLGLLADGARRERMRAAAQGLGQDRAAQNLADALEALA